MSHRMGRRKAAFAFLGAALAPGFGWAQALAPRADPRGSDGGPYVPTPIDVVHRMLDLAKVGPADLVVDLGSGDGRLVIEAARRHGARGRGVERQVSLVEKAREAAAAAKVAARVRFEAGDIFDADLRDATVVTLYLLPGLLIDLAPRLRVQLQPGARIVSHDFALPEWPPEAVVEFNSPEKERLIGIGVTNVFLYRVPRPGEGPTTR